MPEDNGFVPFVQAMADQAGVSATAVECENCDCHDCDVNCEECDNK